GEVQYEEAAEVVAGRLAAHGEARLKRPALQNRSDYLRGEGRRDDDEERVARLNVVVEESQQHQAADASRDQADEEDVEDEDCEVKDQPAVVDGHEAAARLVFEVLLLFSGARFFSD